MQDAWACWKIRQINNFTEILHSNWKPGLLKLKFNYVSWFHGKSILCLGERDFAQFPHCLWRATHFGIFRVLHTATNFIAKISSNHLTFILKIFSLLDSTKKKFSFFHKCISQQLSFELFRENSLQWDSVDI